MDLQLKGKNVLITGATKGIGRAIAEAFVAEGANVAICARNKVGVDQAVADLKEKTEKVFGATVDVADTAALTAWVNEMAETLGGIDIFVSNVSALGTQTDLDTWKQSFAVDVLGTVAGAQAALPHIEQSAAGAIIMVNTTGSVQVFGPPTAYPAVKASGLA